MCSDGAVMTAALPDHLRAMIGQDFPGGYYHLEPYRAWLLADTVGDQPDSAVVHPLHAWLGATEAMGVTWDELFEWFDAAAEDGPMIGDHETVLHKPMVVDHLYQVSGSIIAVDRKHGNTAGIFDLVQYELQLHDGDGLHVATCRNSIVFPRSDA